MTPSFRGLGLNLFPYHHQLELSFQEREPLLLLLPPEMAQNNDWWYQELLKGQAGSGGSFTCPCLPEIIHEQNQCKLCAKPKWETWLKQVNIIHYFFQGWCCSSPATFSTMFPLKRWLIVQHIWLKWWLLEEGMYHCFFRECSSTPQGHFSNTPPQLSVTFLKAFTNQEGQEFRVQVAKLRL